LTSEPAGNVENKQDAFETYLEGLRKRKREVSPETSQKRANRGSEKSGRSPVSEALLGEFDKIGFSPETLTGDLAEEYRDAVIRAMFPGTNIVVPEKGKKKNKPQPSRPVEEELKPSGNADVSHQIYN